MSFCKGIKQPLTDLQLLQAEKREKASEPILWHTHENLNHVRGRCTTGTDDKTHKNRLFIFFYKEGVRELRDPVWRTHISHSHDSMYDLHRMWNQYNAPFI